MQSWLGELLNCVTCNLQYLAVQRKEERERERILGILVAKQVTAFFAFAAALVINY